MSKRRKRRTPGAVADPVPPAAPPPAPARRRGPLRERLALGALLCAVTWVAYLPAVHGGFIWDDSALLIDNPLIKASDGLYRFWFTTEPPDYWPLTSTTLWLEWRLWGMSPVGYHVTNIAFHTVEALLLWAILARLGIGGAYLAALLFAVHPVNVESVAWIAQRKNLIAMLFFLLAVLAYLRDEGREPSSPGRPFGPDGRRFDAISLVMFVLAMLGKGSAAVLPLVLLLLAWWRQRRVTRQDLVRIAPFAAIAAILVVVNVWFQTHGGGHIRDVTFGERILGAGAVVWFYLYKALLPFKLAFVYPLWRIRPDELGWWIPLLAAIAVSVLLWRYRERWSRPYLVAWAFFCIALLPVMGLTDVYFMKFSLVADHYQHIALIAVVTLVAAGWNRWGLAAARSAAIAAAGTVVGALALLTWQQSAMYKDEETLYDASLRKNPDAWLPHHNLGVILGGQGRRQEALPHYEQAIRLNPDRADARANLGIMLDEEGRSSEAIGHLEAALRLDPGSARIHYNLGVVLAGSGRLEEAASHYEEALRAKADDPETLNALGSARNGQGRYEAALPLFEEALRLKPQYPEALANLGLALAQLGRPREAIPRLEEALRVKPDSAEAHYNLGSLLTDAGRNAEAMTHYEEALRLRPAYAAAHNNIGIALSNEGRAQDALSHFKEAIRLQPEFFAARMNLVETCARLGRLEEALSEGQAALSRARSGGQADWERQFQAWLARHRG